MTETTTATVDTQDNTNVSTEQAPAKVTEEETPETEMFKEANDIETEEPFIDPESDKQGEDKQDPVDYGDFDLSAGEQIKYKMTDEQKVEFTGIAKELGLDKEQAQKLIDLDIKRELAKEQHYIAEKQQALKEDTETIRKKYGEKFDESKVLFKKAVKTFMPAALQKTFVDAGFDRNPELFDMMVNIGKQIGEDTFVKGEKKVARKNEGGIKSMFSDLNTAVSNTS